MKNEHLLLLVLAGVAVYWMMEGTVTQSVTITDPLTGEEIPVGDDPIGGA